MAKYFVKKGIQLIIVTILISFFSFAVIYAAPGDISGMYLNEQMSDEEKEAIRENLGLNKSMPVLGMGKRSAERRFRNFSCKPYFRI